MERMKGLEPSASSLARRRSSQLSYIRIVDLPGSATKRMTRLELATFSLGS